MQLIESRSLSRRRTIFAGILLASIILLPAHGYSVGPAKSTTYIRAGWVFDGRRMLENRVIAVSDGLIAGILDSTTSFLSDASLIDAGSSTVMPGFVDSHIHFMAPPLPQAENVTRIGWGKLAKEGYSQYPEHRLGLLRSGITEILDMGGPLAGYRAVRAALRNGVIIGPEVYFPGPLFTAPGGHPAGTTYVGQHDLIVHGTVQAGTASVAVEKVRELAGGGVDYIKIVYDRMWYRPGGVPRLDLGVARAIIDEAHRLGLRVFAHTGSQEEAQAMVDAGIDGIEHGFSSSNDTLFTQMQKKGVFFTPSLVAYVHYAPQAVAPMIETVKRAFDAGVRIAAGTDFPASYGGLCGPDIFREAGLLEKAGIPRVEVLRILTANGAGKAGKEGEFGSMEGGRRANLIFIAGRADEGVLSENRITGVMLRGEMVVEHGKAVKGREKGFAVKSLLTVPYAFWDPITEFNAGLGVTEFDLFNTGISASGDLTYSFRDMWSTTLQFDVPSRIPKTTAKLGFHFDNMNRIHYGIGNDTGKDGGIEYSPAWYSESLVITTALMDKISLTADIKRQRIRISGYGSEQIPASLAECDGLEAVCIGLTPAFDTRDHVMNPWKGFLVRAGGEIAPAFLGSMDTFERVILDARLFLPSFWQGHVLAVRGLYRQAFGDAPSMYLPDYGGAMLGRGYFPGRFSDTIALTAQIEYRFPVLRWLYAAAFLDTGMVLPDGGKPTSFDIHPSGGFGPRFVFGANENAIVAIDFGFSREGVMVFFHPGQVF